MPFSAEELKKILFIIKKSMYKAEEQIFSKGDEKTMNYLIKELDNS
jgi:hypothetical protein